jgi:hypothetical protein
MEDVLAVYARPYDPKRPVVCLGEASKELHSTPHGRLPLGPGQPQRQDYEYERHGVANLFMSLEPLTGRRTVWVTDRCQERDELSANHRAKMSPARLCTLTVTIQPV